MCFFFGSGKLFLMYFWKLGIGYFVYVYYWIVELVWISDRYDIGIGKFKVNGINLEDKEESF